MGNPITIIDDYNFHFFRKNYLALFLLNADLPFLVFSIALGLRISGFNDAVHKNELKISHKSLPS